MIYVIFDIDGTLANTKKVEDKCFMKAFEETFGIDIWNQKWESFTNVTDWGITEEIIQREMNRFPYQVEYEKMISNFIGHLEAEKTRDVSQFSEVTGAKFFFDKLREEEEIELGIATGSWGDSAKLKLDTIGISLEGVCFSNSDFYKSREAITQDVIDRLSSKTLKRPEKIVYFGDGKWDFETCKKLDIDFIGIDLENDGKLTNYGAKTVFRNYSDSTAIFNEMRV